MQNLFRQDPDGVVRFVPWTERPWLEHGFGTRLSVGWNQRKDWISLNQIHSSCAVYVESQAPGRIGQGDALLTRAAGALIGVRTADCAPVLIVDPVRRAAAAIHAGWRGTAQGVALHTVRQMQDRLGSRPEDLEAVIGPAIGVCCYEVGPEVAVRFQQLFPERTDLGGKTRIDLAEANRRQLLDAGLSPGRIWTAKLCTCCSPGLFHSYRRDGQKAGRMVSGILIRA